MGGKLQALVFEIQSWRSSECKRFIGSHGIESYLLNEKQKRAKSEKSKICSVVSDFLQPHGLYSPWNSPGQNTGVGRSLSRLQGIFQTQGSNPGLLYCRWILYQLSHKGSPRTLECVTYPFSSGSSLDLGNKPESPALQVDSLPTELSGKPILFYWMCFTYFLAVPSTNGFSFVLKK